MEHFKRVNFMVRVNYASIKLLYEKEKQACLPEETKENHKGQGKNANS